MNCALHINAVIGFSELILGDASPDDIKKFSRIINTSGYNLLEIVEGIFDIALIDSGLAQMKKSEFSVNKLIREIYTTAIVFQEQTGKTQITIVGKPEPDQKDILLYTDHGKLRQILNHLLKNAVKFTEAGLIEFGYAGGMDEGNPVITFYVRDTGIGISGKSQEIIFDLFRQEDNSHTRKYRGTGIGLSVVKRLIQLLGGRIWVESEPGKGSAFFFTLPADQMDREPTPVKTTGIISAGMKFSGKTILIAEDEESNFELLGAMMAGMAIRLVWARNGKEAVLMSLSDPSVELVLMDIRMPIMNGYEATRMIKKVRPGLPVVAQTANALSRDRGEAISAGCDDYIEKPIRKRDLLNVLVKYLSA